MASKMAYRLLEPSETTARKGVKIRRRRRYVKRRFRVNADGTRTEIVEREAAPRVTHRKVTVTKGGKKVRVHRVTKTVK